jgi:hypothetical protein
MAKVIPLNTVTRLDIPADRVLNAALAAGLEKVVVLGYSADETYFASSIANGPEVLWLLEKLKLDLLTVEVE